MVFKPVKAEDKEVIEKYMKQMNSRSCDMSFATVYLWSEYYRSYYTICEDMLIFQSGGPGHSFSFPIGKKDPADTIEALAAYCKKEGYSLRFHCVSIWAKEYLDRNYPGKFEVTFDQDYADYIYERQALIELKGKKYHGKKNHVNKFMKTYEWSYEAVDENNLDECLAMLDAWKEQNCASDDEEKKAEVSVSRKALLQREFLGLRAGLIRADGNVVAFSVGESISDDTFVVHIEKAYADVPGAYSIINQQFILHEAEGYSYVNREDDVGNPGLRKAKMSYHPVFMEEKGYAILKGCLDI